MTIARYPGNPILSAADAPYDCTLLFNAGVCKYEGKYVMVFRNDYGSTREDFESGRTKVFASKLGIAYSEDGINFAVEKRELNVVDTSDGETIRAYDPRLTVIEGKVYLCFALDTRHGIRGGIAVTEDFERFDILHLTVPDNRNMVLFPERLAGRFVRLERPFPVYSRGGADRFDIWISASPDCIYWGESSLLLGVEDVPFANDKIGPAAPPVKTPQGWLTLFHAVWRHEERGKNGWEPVWKKEYSAGIMLLDPDDPRRIVAISKRPLMRPTAPYEVEGGFRNHVIFPTGMILEESGEVKIYYGAADTCMCLATADVDDLLAFCRGDNGHSAYRE